MHTPSFIPLLLLVLTLSTSSVLAAAPSYHVTNYISDCIGSFCYYEFSITYTPPAAATTNNTKVYTEPAFNTTCSWTTDDGTDWVNCENGAVKTVGDFSDGVDAKLKVLHTWTLLATAAHPAETVTRQVSTTVQLYLGTTGRQVSFRIGGGAEKVVTTSTSTKTAAKARRTTIW